MKQVTTLRQMFMVLAVTAGTALDIGEMAR